jgi:hypothetical protein
MSETMRITDKQSDLKEDRSACFVQFSESASSELSTLLLRRIRQQSRYFVTQLNTPGSQTILK